MQIGKRSSKYVILCLASTAALLAACESTEEAGSNSQEAPVVELRRDCWEDFSRIITPIDINGGHHLYFEPSNIAFFADPNLRIQSVLLNATVHGKMKGNSFEIPLAVNGLQSSGRDGSSFYELLQYSAGQDSSDVRFQIQKMVVNGAEPILNFMLKVLGNSGSIKLSLQGKNLHVLSANLEVSGYSHASGTSAENHSCCRRTRRFADFFQYHLSFLRE